MMRILSILASSIVAAGCFLIAREHAVSMSSGVTVASASLFAAPVPVVAAALAFPALYLLWEQSDL